MLEELSAKGALTVFAAASSGAKVTVKLARAGYPDIGAPFSMEAARSKASALEANRTTSRTGGLATRTTVPTRIGEVVRAAIDSACRRFARRGLLESLLVVIVAVSFMVILLRSVIAVEANRFHVDLVKKNADAFLIQSVVGG